MYAGALLTLCNLESATLLKATAFDFHRLPDTWVPVLIGLLSLYRLAQHNARGVYAAVKELADSTNVGQQTVQTS